MLRSWTVALAALFLFTQSADERAAWNRPVEPFRIIGNVYYVGAAGVSAFLIHSPEGSILLDGGLPETAPRIAESVAKLGFDIRDVMFLLNSHAHFDHSGGLYELKQRTGAAVVASEQDAPLVRDGHRGHRGVPVDRMVRDGETVKAGGAAMTAHLTPGHTKGCTTWTTTVREGGRDYRVLFHCSTSVVDTLIGNREYPHIVHDYQRTFATLAAMKADVFLHAHPSFFGMEEKRKRMAAGSANPFVDPAELQRFNERSRRQFEEALKKERGRLRARR